MQDEIDYADFVERQMTFLQTLRRKRHAKSIFTRFS